MKTVKFKNKKANHSLYVNGERIVFVNGEVIVEDSVARIIKEMKDPDYKVIEPKKERKPRARKAKAKP
jgi:hypothetical protein